MSKIRSAKIFSVYTLVLSIAYIIVLIPGILWLPSIVIPLDILGILMIVLSIIVLKRLSRNTNKHTKLIKIILCIYCIYFLALLITMIFFDGPFIIFIWPILLVIFPMIHGYNSIWADEND